MTRARMRAALYGVVIATCALPSPRAGADDGDAEIAPPIAPATSGEASLLSGRTLGTGEVMVAGAAGWPWIWAQLELAPTPSFNLGIRVALLYGTPIMALQAGVGAELAVPARIHLYGDTNVDVAIRVMPAVTVGEGAVVGEANGVYAGDLGYSSRLEAGVLLGVRPVERFTVFFGAGGHFGFVHTPAAGDPQAVGASFATLGAEGLISRDTMLFAAIDAGIGIAPARGALTLFGESVAPVLRIALGVAYLL